MRNYPKTQITYTTSDKKKFTKGIEADKHQLKIDAAQLFEDSPLYGENGSPVSSSDFIFWLKSNIIDVDNLVEMLFSIRNQEENDS